MSSSVPIRLRQAGKKLLKCSGVAVRRRKREILQRKNHTDGNTYLLHWGLCLIAFVGILGIALISFVLSADAACPEGARLVKTGGIAAAEKAFEMCAIGENDDESQVLLGNHYLFKKNATTHDNMKALFYFHLAAENGNARGQVALAKILMRMDSSDEERAVLVSYIEQMKAMMSNKGMRFTGEIMHPYALLILAAESPDQKWYYPTTTKTETESKLLLNGYELPPAKKQEVIRQATKWKQQKMIETAEEVLGLDEFREFMETVYPQQGRADAFKRQQAIQRLQDAVEEYLQ